MPGELLIEIRAPHMASGNALAGDLQFQMQKIMPLSKIKRMKAEGTQDLGVTLVLLLGLVAGKALDAGVEKAVEKVIDEIWSWLLKHREAKVAIKDDRGVVIVVMGPGTNAKEVVEAVLAARQHHDDIH